MTNQLSFKKTARNLDLAQALPTSVIQMVLI